jgi:hypothetical protein
MDDPLPVNVVVLSGAVSVHVYLRHASSSIGLSMHARAHAQCTARTW